MDKKTVYKKSFAKAIISAVILLILLVFAGTIYTWYAGRHVESSSFADPVDQADYVDSKITVVKPAENVPESVAVQSFTDQVLPGTNAAISIRTKPDSVCKISVTYNEIASTDSGLIDKIADEYGLVSWSWSVEASAPFGKWPVKVTCYYGEQWAVGTGDLQVVSEIK